MKVRPFQQRRSALRPLASVLLALLSVLLALPSSGAEAETPADTGTASFLIVNPAGRGNQGLAEGFLGDFSKALASAWPKGSTSPHWQGRYRVTAADALASMRREKPIIALVSPGFYLANRTALDLHVLAVPLRCEGKPVVRILAPSGRIPANPPRLGGQLAGEPDWLMNVVIGQDRAWLHGEPVLVPVTKTLEAIRMAQAGQLDHVALHDADWMLLQRLGKAQGWDVVATSQPLPEGPVVSIGPPSVVAQAAASALIGFSGTDAGKSVLGRMGLKGFAASTDQVFDAVAERFSAAKAERASEQATPSR